MSADGRLIATAYLEGDVTLWDADTVRRRVTVEKGAAPAAAFVRALAFAPDGKTIGVARNLTGSGLDLCDTTTGRRLPWSESGGTAPLPPHALAFAPDGRIVAISREALGVSLHEVATGKEVRRLLDGSEARQAGLAFSPDGRSLLTAEPRGGVRLWEMATGKTRWGLRPDNETQTTVAASPDGRLVAMTGRDGAVRVLHTATGQTLRTFTGHEGLVTALAFAAGGKLLSVGADGTAFLWDAAGLRPGAKPAAKIDAEAVWASLADGDAARAYQTLARLGAAPAVAVDLLRQRLKPADTVNARRIDQLIARLDDDDFAVREQATRDLEKLGRQAQGALRRVAQAPPSAEVAQRAAELLKKIDGGAASGEGLRQTRALEVLEGIGTAEAKKVLEELAKGAPDARLTQEAKASLERLAKRAAAP
jgi:sugar lactone lactonase YvrE